MQGCGFVPKIPMQEDHNFVPETGKFNICAVCESSLAFHTSQVPKPDSPYGPGWVWNKDHHLFRQHLNGWFCITYGKDPAGHWERIELMSAVHKFKAKDGVGSGSLCALCGRELNDYEYHVKPDDRPVDFMDRVFFASGASSGGIEPPYHLMAWEGVDCTALRYGYGNQKHEDGQTVLAEANWLKAFHGRDLKFFRDRAAHAIKHIRKEMAGHRDKAPGGNWGAVGWCQDMMPYVAKYDPVFYAAVTGLIPHPGPHPKDHRCPCPRCEAVLQYHIDINPSMQGNDK